ncbi:hypothetical protein GCK32_004316 [Trichostrongylus colubriformis]|uniref:Uncharacterized protein n=1 Tax=Trichostrongylus colubriformis TaxID=6319 RepID=A0AAN8F7X6_TRICO
MDEMVYDWQCNGKLSLRVAVAGFQIELRRMRSTVLHFAFSHCSSAGVSSFFTNDKINTSKEPKCKAELVGEQR